MHGSLVEIIQQMVLGSSSRSSTTPDLKAMHHHPGHINRTQSYDLSAHERLYDSEPLGYQTCAWGQNRGVFASKLMAACGCDVMGAEAALPSTWDGGTANAAGCEYVFGNQVSPSAY